MNIFQLFGTIAVNNANALNGISETEGAAQKASSKIGKAFDKIGSAAVACGKVIATGLAVGAAAFGTLAYKALNAAGELEQNLGGASAVFGEYAAKMEETAKTAFSSMGLSASDFLATANKMGSLFKGAGFEVEDAAEITTVAMQRAADVASIMGIDVSVAMESIAGAAKGNFTMMDNLGVAINDTNMQAYALEKGLNASTSAMTTQEKIALAMQMFLEKTADYAGNYAKENDTLAGSLTTAKAAFSNFLSGVGDANEVADALASSGKVISKKILVLLPALVTGLGTLFNALIPELPPLLQTLLPTVIDGVIGLIQGLVSAGGTLIKTLLGIVPSLIDGMKQILSVLVSTILDNAEMILDAGLELLLALADGFLSGLPKLESAILQLIEKIANWIIEEAPLLIETAVRVLGDVVAAIARALPKLLAAIADAIVKALPGVLKAFGSLWTQLDSGLMIVGGLIIAFKGMSIITTVVSLIGKLKTAFSGLNTAMSANPIGLIVSGIGLAIATFGAFKARTDEVTEEMCTITAEFKALEDEVNATRESIIALDEEYSQNASMIDDEIDRTEDLWKELQNLTDETGYVTDANKDRAEYLLGELNTALGTEYEMNGNIIGQYQQMQGELDTLIQKRRAERLLEEYDSQYAAAQNDYNTRKSELYASKKALDDFYTNFSEQNQGLENRFATFMRNVHGTGAFTQYSEDLIAGNPAAAESALDHITQSGSSLIGDDLYYNAVELLEELRAAYNDDMRDAEERKKANLASAEENFLAAETDMQRYNDAEYAIASGDYEKAIDLLLDGTNAYWNALEEGKDVTDEEREALLQSMKQEEAALEAYRKGLEIGDPLLNQERFGELLEDFVEKLDLLGGEYEYIYGTTEGLVNGARLGLSLTGNAAYPYSQAGNLNADTIEVKPVSLGDEAMDAVNDLKTEISRLAEVVNGVLTGEIQIKINSREFGRLVRAVPQ